MSVYDYEKYRQRQQKIEVKALIALLDHASGQGKKDVVKRLVEIALPDLLIEDLDNQTKL
jgi:hypothetical protein